MLFAVVVHCRELADFVAVSADDCASGRLMRQQKIPYACFEPVNSPSDWSDEYIVGILDEIVLLEAFFQPALEG